MNTLELRKALGQFATGVTIITTVDSAGEYIGFTANSFGSVSLNPPIVSWCLGLDKNCFEIFSNTRNVAISILSNEQQQLADRFASFEGDRFSGVDCTLGQVSNCPIMTGAIAYFECTITQQYKAGDHAIFLAQVENFAHTDKQPLIFMKSEYSNP